jgi:hypothetical protein
LGQPVRVSSINPKDNFNRKAELVVDGDRSSGWMSDNGGEKWVAVDLGEAKSISVVEVSVGTRLEGCIVEVSIDGINWKEVYSREREIPGIISYVDVFSFTPAPARWVRLRFNDTDGNKAYFIKELAVYK